MKKIKGILVIVDTESFYDTAFTKEYVEFNEQNNLPKTWRIRKPTNFYRYISGKKFLVYADEVTLKNIRSSILTLAITENGNLTSDRLYGNLFICNVDENELPINLTNKDIKLILSQITEEYFDYTPTQFIKSEITEIKGEN